MLTNPTTLVFLIALLSTKSEACEPTVTTASGAKAPLHICSGQLIFEDNFETFDVSTWQHISTLSGGRASEFQWYVDHPDTSFAKNGNLHIRPRLTSDYFDEKFLSSGRVIIPMSECNNAAYSGCDKQGTFDDIINPVRSARIRTIKSFSFKYGTLEVRAKLPAGDWLWPAIWLLPTRNLYGSWPNSGEIDLMESRGNRKLFANGTNVGVEQVGSTLHFGPRTDINGWRTAHYQMNNKSTYSNDFHTYKLVWTPTFIRFFIDGFKLGTVMVGDGFWTRGGFESSGLPNLWANASSSAPFDQEFHIILNVAVGGTGYFNDNFKNEGARKPWSNTSPHPARDFWRAKSDWLPTWNYNQSDDADLQVDYVRVWAL